ncbi:MAG: carbohydrate kinase [Rhodobacteraceae bacterium]|nr:carbohydrate kinase [Paracoccaceae bacterium]
MRGKARLLCAGEALIDMLPRQTAEGETAFVPYPGGATYNAAIAAARLGLPTTVFTGLSTDLFGARLTRAMEADGVDTSLALRTGRPTTLAFVSLTRGHAQYEFYDENTAGRMIGVEEIPAIPGGVAAALFGGISLAVEPAAEAYAALADRAQAAGKVVMLDPNIRPGFISDPARYRARLDRLLAKTDILKLSDEDLHWWQGTGDAQALLGCGPSLVLLTRGAKGAVAYRKGGAVEVAADPVGVVDTIGAGDTFNAGFLAGLEEAGALTRDGLQAAPDDVLTAALTLATRAAAVTVSRAGANPPMRSDLA